MKVKKGFLSRLPFFPALLVVLVIWMLFSAISLVQAQDDPPLIHSGKQRLSNGEYEQAIINFSEHLKRHGFDREAYYWRAHCLIMQDYLEDAVADLKLILQYHPDDSRAMDAIGYANNQRGNYLEAINWFNEAIVLDEENAVIYNNRGMSYYYLGKFPTAFHDFNKAVRLDTSFAEAYSNRGSARYNNQNIAAATDIDLRKAESDFSRALELDEGLVSAYRNRGIIRFHLKKYQESFLDLQKAIYLHPADPIVYYHMGNLMMALEEYREAVTYLGECLKLDPDMSEAVYQRALAYIQLDELDLARYDYEVIINNFHDDRGKCFFLIARTYAMEDQPKLVYSFLKQARKNGYFKSATNLQGAYDDPLLIKYRDKDNFWKFWNKLIS
jgi:tetratricopeptide (TPR) repeat protein